MYQNFDDLICAVQALPTQRTVCIANAANEKIMHLVHELQLRSLCRMILVGDAEKIRMLAEQEQVSLKDVTVIHATETEQIARLAVEQVSSGEADVYVKGSMNTSDFLRSVLNKEVGLRSGGKLSVLTCYEVPKQPKLFFMTDGGMVVAPTLEDKAAIVTNAVNVLHNMGIDAPKVAILSSNEKVSEKIPSTVDAQALCRMADAGELPHAIYEGPIAFDVAMRPDAAGEKGIKSRVSGDVDLFLVPNIETGNCLGKAIGYFGGGETAGLVIGARKPIVMSSRAASVRGKLASVAWALLACENEKEDAK